MVVSKVIQSLPPSGIRAFFDLVLGMKDVISLGVGEPDFVTPWAIRERAIYSIEQGFTSYTSNKGLIELRKAIAKSLQSRYDLQYSVEEEILVTVGGSEALDLACRAILNPGDKVLYHEPCFVSYAPLVKMAGGIPVPIYSDVQHGFKLTVAQLEKSWQKGVKALILNYPCNPTGTSYTRAELLKIAQFVRQKNMIVISDEIYAELTYDFEHTPFSTLPGMKERTIYVNGFSKSYAMTGWRMGWVAGPSAIIAAMTKIHQYTMMCASIMSQMAACEAMKNADQAVLKMKKEYYRRRNYIVDSLNGIGLSCHMPQGAFYAFPCIKKSNMKALDFAQDLLLKEKVALIPGSAFGAGMDDYVRISYASSMDNLKEAIFRLKRYLQSDTQTTKRKK